jgi:hypothetical protein
MKHKARYCIDEGKKISHQEMTTKDHCRRQCNNMSDALSEQRETLNQLWNKSVPKEAPSKERD